MRAGGGGWVGKSSQYDILFFGWKARFQEKPDFQLPFSMGGLIQTIEQNLSY
jgi:hypothetical protein